MPNMGIMLLFVCLFLFAGVVVVVVAVGVGFVVLSLMFWNFQWVFGEGGGIAFYVSLFFGCTGAFD